jgi:hypothetical protein
VEALDGSDCGDALDEVQKLDLHNVHSLVCVRPTFAEVPWYANHPTRRHLSQEDYLVQVVVPFVEKMYEAHERVLLGFSKSGLLRHPVCFQRRPPLTHPWG